MERDELTCHVSALPGKSGGQAHFVYNDVWTSMGQKKQVGQPVRNFDCFQVYAQLLSQSTTTENETVTKLLH